MLLRFVGSRFEHVVPRHQARWLEFFPTPDLNKMQEDGLS